MTKIVEKSSGTEIEPTHGRSLVNHSRNFYVHVSERMWQKVHRIVEAEDDIQNMTVFIRMAIREKISNYAPHFIDDRPVVWRAPPVAAERVVDLLLDRSDHLSTYDLADALGVKRNTIYKKLSVLEKKNILVRSTRRIQITAVSTKGRKYLRWTVMAFWGLHKESWPMRAKRFYSR